MTTTTERPGATAITCPVCGRTSFNPNDRENGWCGACNAATAPQGVHPELVTIQVAATRARLVAGLETDPTAELVRALADLLAACSVATARVGTAGHVCAHNTALALLAATRHLEK